MRLRHSLYCRRASQRVLGPASRLLQIVMDGLHPRNSLESRKNPHLVRPVKKAAVLSTPQIKRAADTEQIQEPKKRVGSAWVKRIARHGWSRVGLSSLASRGLCHNHLNACIDQLPIQLGMWHGVRNKIIQVARIH